MTDLQMALVALGALIIVAVIFFNWWQERSLRNEVSQPFEQARRDPLMDEFRIDPDALPEEKLKPGIVDDVDIAAELEPYPELEPEQRLEPEPPLQPFPPTIPHDIKENPAYSDSISNAASAVAEFEEDMATPVDEAEVNAIRQTYMEENPAAEDETASSEELMEEAGLDSELATPAAAMPQPGEEISLPLEVNQQIDLIALLYLKNPATGAALREFLLTLTDLDKSVYGYGMGADGAWHMLTREEESSEFSRVLCSLQLVDRAGAVTREALSRFQKVVADMAGSLGATVEWHGDSDTMAYAADLDRFCVDVDKLVGFHLIQGESPFTGTKLRGLAEASGMVLRSDGTFSHESENGQSQYAMVSQDGIPFSPDSLRTALIRGVTFQLDIPHVANCTEVFNQMVLAARQMESSLGGQLVDANQKPLGEIQIEKIRQELKMIQAKMVARGIIPGSLVAQRLFS